MRTADHRWLRRLAPALMLAALAAGCASIRSELQSAYTGEVKRNPDPTPVSVAFVFSHVRQTIGRDAVPKLVNKGENVSGFDEILGDALPERAMVVDRRVAEIGKR